jgi:hypothetical protein
MATQKPVRLIYKARNGKTGLTDVKAQIFFNGVAKGSVNATELGYGVYEVLLTAANLTAWGVTPQACNAVEVIVDSATAPASAVFKIDVTVANSDDLEAHLVTQDTTLTSIKTDTTAIRSDLESAASSLPNILQAINQIQNNAGFALAIPSTLLRPASGSNTYRFTEFVYNRSNALIDPDGNAVTVTAVNQAGADRSSYLVGYVAGTGGALGSAPAVRDSQGRYHIDIQIPNTAAQEQLNFTFSYAIGGASTARAGTSEIITDVQADGFALQTTLLDVQARDTDIQSKINDQTIGLAAANTLQSSIKTALLSLQSDVTSNVEGVGFVAASDSLHAISAYLQTALYSGGVAV